MSSERSEHRKMSDAEIIGAIQALAYHPTNQPLMGVLIALRDNVEQLQVNVGGVLVEVREMQQQLDLLQATPDAMTHFRRELEKLRAEVMSLQGNLR